LPANGTSDARLCCSFSSNDDRRRPLELFVGGVSLLTEKSLLHFSIVW